GLEDRPAGRLEIRLAISSREIRRWVRIGAANVRATARTVPRGKSMKKAAIVLFPLAVGVASLYLTNCGKSSPSPTAPSQEQPRTPAAAVPPTTRPRVHGPSIGAACDSLPMSQVADHDCFGQQKDFSDAVNRAVDLAAAKPDLAAGTTSLRLGLFYYDVIKNLSDAGYCAIWDAGLELQVRDARRPADPHSES